MWGHSRFSRPGGLNKGWEENVSDSNIPGKISCGSGRYLVSFSGSDWCRSYVKPESPSECQQAGENAVH